MTIETKFDIGQEVWYVLFTTHYSGKISSINISVVNGISLIYYSLENMPTQFSQNALFRTKQALLDSLK